MSSLSKWLKPSEAANEKPMFLIYADCDRGKTSLAAQFPSPAFIRVGDVGVRELQQYELVPSSIPSTEMIEKLDDFHEVLNDIFNADEKDRPKTLVIDGMGGVQELIFKKVVERDYSGDRAKFLAYGTGPERCVPEMQSIIARLNQIRKLGVTIIMLAHAGTMNDVNPAGSTYIKLVPALAKPMVSVLMAECPNVGFIEPVIVTTEDGNKVKALGNTRPPCFLHFVGRAALNAKNKVGITAPIPMGNSAKEAYNNFMAAVVAAVKANKERNKEAA